MSTKLRRGRSRVAVLAVVAMVAGLLALPVSAGAATAACPDTIPSAGFTDMAGYSTAAQDAVDCIAFYGVTAGVGGGLYGPAQNVPRWQMAIFLASVLETGNATLDTSDFGFTDISDKSTAAQDAINAIANAGVTAGIGGGLYGPDIDVPRWQMAIFLASVLEELNVTIDTTAFGFTDISAKSTAAQNAINAIANAGISVGTGGGLFAPDAEVTRVQMGLFLAAELDEAGVVPAGTIAVSPTDAAELKLGSTGKVTRQYTASVGFLEKVSLQLWSGDDVNSSGKLVSPTSSATGALITVVNGVATGAASSTAVIADVVPTAGSVTFTVEYTAQNLDGVFPAVFSGTSVAGLTGASATAPKTPTNDAFATGGVSMVLNPGASAASVGPALVDSVNKTSNYVIAGGAAWFYDDNDTFAVAGAPATASSFESKLSAGDTITITPYAADAALVSSWNITINTPTAPDTTAAVAGTDITVTVVAANPTYANMASTDLFNIYRATADDGADNICGNADDTVGTYSLLLSKAKSDDDTAGAPFDWEFEGQAVGCYYFVSTVTVDGEESAKDATAATAEVVADVTAPVLSSATPKDVDDGIGSTNQIVVDFDESVALLDATKFSVSPIAQPAIVFKGVSATVSGDKVTVTLDGSINDAAINIGYLVTVKKDAVEDLSGNNFAADASTAFGY